MGEREYRNIGKIGDARNVEIWEGREYKKERIVGE